MQFEFRDAIGRFYRFTYVVSSQLNSIFVCAGDIFIVSSSPEENVSHLGNFCARLTQSGAKVSTQIGVLCGFY